MSFKVHTYEAFWSPSGMYVAIRENIGKPGWIVRVLNFATWVHKTYEFPGEAEARAYARLWTI